MKKSLVIALILLIILLTGCSADDKTTTTQNITGSSSQADSDILAVASDESIDQSIKPSIWDDFTDAVTLTVNTNTITLKSNGLPDHETGEFPNNNNPNSIRAQNHEYQIPKNPVANADKTLQDLSPFGMAVNGVLYDPGAAEWFNNDRNSGWQLNAIQPILGLDENNAHVQPSGAYHYHGVPEGIIDESRMQLVGIAADGYPMFHDDSFKSSWRLKSGTRPNGPGGLYDGTYNEDFEYVAGLGDLDECNGAAVEVPYKEYDGSTYAYFVTDDFPYIGRCFTGTPDDSFIAGAAQFGSNRVPPPSDAQRPPPPR